MLKYDPIDIFFIAIIGMYFIVLVCLFITLIILGINKCIKRKKGLMNTKEEEEKEINPIVKTLFMKEITKEKVIPKKEVKTTSKKTNKKKASPKKNTKSKKKSPAKKTVKKSSNTTNKAKKKKI